MNAAMARHLQLFLDRMTRAARNGTRDEIAELGAARVRRIHQIS